MVTTDLLEVPNGTYTLADTEWKDGRSDVLYVPRLGIQSSLPPILIEVQKTVHEPFMQRLIHYCQNVLQIYKSYPMVLVFCTDKVSPSPLMTKFKAIDDKSWFHSLICCDFWAKSCYLVSKLTMSTIEVNVNLRPLQALSSFLIEQSSTLYGHTYAQDPTLQRLYLIAKNALKNHEQHELNFTESLNVICSNNEKIFGKAEAAIKNIPGASKARKLIKRGLEYNASVKRKYSSVEDSDSSLEPLPNHRFTDTTTEAASAKEDDFAFVLDYKKKLVGRMSWDRCLEVAQSKNLCKRFSTGASLRAFFNSESKK